jgi:hypothetical protein
MHIIMPSFGGIGGPLFIVCHTWHSRSILRTYWSCFIIAKRFISYVCMFSSSSVLFCGMIVSVADCRHSGCSYNVESNFVETNLYQRALSQSFVYEWVTAQQDTIWEELKISHVQIYFVSGARKSQAPGRRSD